MKLRQNELLIAILFLVLGTFLLSEEPILSIVTPTVPSETLVTTSAAITTTDSAIIVTTENAINTNNEDIKKVEEKKDEIKENKYSLDNYTVVSSDSEKGKASYYAKKFHGNKTTSGEKFSIYKLTAAHRTLKFGTMVKVTNTDNGKSVVVRINDRGPFTKSKLIDLSPAAFEELASLSKGVINVKIEVVKEKDTSK